MLKKKLAVVGGSILLCTMLGASVFASTTSKIEVNGIEVGDAVKTKVESGTVWVPAAEFAEALGAQSSWDNDTQTLKVSTEESLKQSQYIIKLLEYALVAKTPQQAVDSWVNAVKLRNGAQQYALLSENLRQQVEKDMKSFNWVTGGSSPWMESYNIHDAVDNGDDTWSLEVEANYTNSAKENSTKTWHVTVVNENDAWYVADTNGYTDIFK